MRQPVSIIVPAYNAESTLNECLNALRAAMRPGDELLLFDDGSTDTTQAIAEAAGARIVRNPGSPKGPAHGRNTAAASATHPYLMFVDADVIIHRDAIDLLGEEVARTGSVATFGSYDDHPRSKRLPALYANLRHHFVHQAGSRDATTFWTGIGLIEAEAFRDFGGYDEELFAHPSIEDVELGMRLINSGRKIRLVPEAQGTHWKDWTLWRVWHTDVVRRALPWSRLIADGQLAVPDLNLARKERLLAVAALTLPVLLLGGFFAHWIWLGAAAVAVFFLLGIRQFIGLLSRRMNLIQLAGAIGMHWFYYVYASAAYALIMLGTRLGLRRRADRSSPLPLKRAELAQ